MIFFVAVLLIGGFWAIAISIAANAVKIISNHEKLIYDKMDKLTPQQLNLANNYLYQLRSQKPLNQTQLKIVESW